MASVRFERVEKRYGEVQAVCPLDLVIEDGEFLVLLGPSGCGKTTLLRMVAGLEEITRGDLYIGDRRVNDVRARDRNIAMVFQSYALYPHLSVAENLGFPLRVRRIDRETIRKRVHDVAGILGLEPLLQRKPKQLSGGQRQRVALGRAMMRHPEVFLFDEPLSNLDASLREEMRGELIRFHRRLGKTVIYVTHDQVEALSMAHRIVVMRNGVIQQVGEPRQVYQEPANMFVAGFLGSPTMNFLPGFLVSNGSASVLEIAGVSGRFDRRYGKAGAKRDVVVGVRPEDLEAAPQPAGSGLSLRGTVRSLQPIGSAVLLDVAAADQGNWTAVAQSDWKRNRYRAGDEIWLTLDPDALQLFDPDSGERLKALV